MRKKHFWKLTGAREKKKLEIRGIRSITLFLEERKDGLSFWTTGNCL